MKENSICEKILKYIYNISNQPVKLNRLLEANLLLQDGMKLDGSKLGFRIRLGRAYLVFFIFVHIVIIPLVFIFHNAIKHLDCHFAILLAIVFTSFLFGLFSIFKQQSGDKIAELRIKQMWRVHFPHFPYDEYSKTISDIYLKSLEEDVKSYNLERYILDNLSNI